MTQTQEGRCRSVSIWPTARCSDSPGPNPTPRKIEKKGEVPFSFLFFFSHQRETFWPEHHWHRALHSITGSNGSQFHHSHTRVDPSERARKAKQRGGSPARRARSQPDSDFGPSGFRSNARPRRKSDSAAQRDRSARAQGRRR